MTTLGHTILLSTFVERLPHTSYPEPSALLPPMAAARWEETVGHADLGKGVFSRGGGLGRTPRWCQGTRANAQAEPRRLPQARP